MSETISRRSLAADFAPPAPAARSARLVDALPPRPRELVEPEPPAPRIPSAAPTPTAPTAAARSSTAHDIVRSVAVYLPPHLLERLRRLARTEDLTYADVLVRAASNHIDTIATRFTPQAPAPAPGGMPTRTRPVRPAGVQTQLRLDGHQLTWLEDAVRRLRAPSRTALVVALLEKELLVDAAPRADVGSE